MDIIWKLLDRLPMPWQTLVVLATLMVSGMVSLALLVKKLRGPVATSHMETVIRENAQELRQDVRRVGENLEEFKVSTANHFGALDARMEAFEGKLDDHDQRGRELRADVKEAINRKTRMV
jgi:hypothetical protein